MVCTYIDEEVITFLDLVVKTQSSRKTDGKTASNIKIFDNVGEKVYGNGNPNGWEVKTGGQWRVKWKALKSKYNGLKTVF